MTGESSALAAVLAAGLHQCSTVVGAYGGLNLSLFLTGLIGSLTHCSGMCGPFVLAQMACRLEQVPLSQMRESHRWRAALLLPYHLGRLTTYAGLGMLAAMLTSLLDGVTGLHRLSAILLLGAAVVMVLLAVPGLKQRLGGLGESSALFARLGQRVAPLLNRPGGRSGYLLGLLLGFIPCGLLYAALAAAGAAGSPVQGGLGMLAFAAGTVPSLFVIGIAGQLAERRWRGLFARYSPALLLVNAALLVMLAWQHLAGTA